jgi:hypothetical protein
MYEAFAAFFECAANPSSLCRFIDFNAIAFMFGHIVFRVSNIKQFLNGTAHDGSFVDVCASPAKTLL